MKALNINILFVICFFFFRNNSEAQTLGCTDPLATNYNLSATHNDGSCVYNAASIAPVSSFSLANTISETSGLIKWNDNIWTHNDNTDTNIYALDTSNGTIIQAYPLNGITNTDWEEISQDDNYIYIGDFGNNANGNRTDLKIYRIDKNSILLSSPLIDTIHFSYSNQTDFSPAGPNNTDFDCEALIVSKDSIFLFTKQWVSNKTSLYSISKNPGPCIAQLKFTFDVKGLVTGATYLESKKLIVLCGYSNLLQPFTWLLYDFTGTDFFSGNKRNISLSLPFHQTEGIATSNGLKYFISNEYFNKPPFVTTLQKLHILDLSSFLNTYINNSTNILENDNQNSFSISPNPAVNSITVRSDVKLINTAYTIYDNSGKTVLTGKLNAENTRIELGNLPEGIYMLNAGSNAKNTFRVIKN